MRIRIADFPEALVCHNLTHAHLAVDVIFSRDSVTVCQEFVKTSTYLNIKTTQPGFHAVRNGQRREQTHLSIALP